MAELNERQLRAANTLEGSLFIDAAAGSGKTRVLAERFAKLVGELGGGEEEVVSDRLLTITFTEKAAGELCKRVGRGLVESGLALAARELPNAWVSTIHGFCARILRANAIEAGIDPYFEVVDPVLLGLLRERAFEVAGRRLAQDSKQVADLLAQYGTDRVARAVLEIHDRLRGMGARVSDVTPEVKVDAPEPLEEAITAYTSAAASFAECEGDTATLRDNRRRCGEALLELAELGESSLASADICASIRATLADHKPGLRGLAGREAAEVLNSERLRIGTAAASAMTAPHTHALLQLVEGFGEELCAAKAERGLVDFADLELYAVRLLEERPDLAERYRQQFVSVMVDEFQDTNAVQCRIVDAVSRGNLCVVGDRNQSIYGFRHADVEAYAAAVSRMAANGAGHVELVENYRTHADILNFISALFASPDILGSAAPTLIPARHEPEQSRWPALLPRVEAIFATRAPGERQSSATAAAEATALAERIRTVVEEGVAPGDIAVLMRALTHAERYASALRSAGVPCVVTAGSGFFSRPEVCGMLALLRSAIDRRDDEACGLYLAGPLVQLGDDALYRARLAAGDGSLREGVAQLCSSGALADEELARATMALEARDRAAARSREMPLADVVLGAIADLDMRGRLAGLGAEGEQALANLEKLARMAEQYEKRLRGGLVGFVRHAETHQRLGLPEPQATLSSGGAGAVRIMSVHAAKGLEFDVVAVVELGRDPWRASAIYRLGLGEDGRLGLGVSVADGLARKGVGESECFTLLCDAQVDADAREEKRLFYVACTRAREALILAGQDCLEVPRELEADRPIHWLRSALGLGGRALTPGASEVELGSRVRVTVVGNSGVVVECGEVETPSLPPALVPIPPLSGRVASPVMSPKEPPGVPFAMPPEIPRLGDIGLPPATISYTDLAAFEKCGMRFLAERLMRLETPRAEADRDKRLLGTAVHAALRLMVATGAPPARERLEALVRLHGLSPGTVSLIEEAVSAARRSTAVSELGSADLIAAEAPFSVALGSATRLVGAMDVFARRDREALVIDHKTGKGSGGDKAAREEASRRLQAECYALAALASGAERAEVVFVELGDVDEGHAPAEERHGFEAAEASELSERILQMANSITWSALTPRKRFGAACVGCPALGGMCPVSPPRGHGSPRARGRTDV